MIVFSIGLPGRFAQWCDAAVAYVVGYPGGTVVVKTWPALADMLGYDGVSSVLHEAVAALIETTATHVVIGARQPDERLRAALDETKARFVLALADPRAAVVDILTATNAQLRSITRAIANSCPLVMRYGSLPGALTLDLQTTATGADAVSKIARHLEIAISDAEAARIADVLAAAGLTYPQNGLEDWPAHISGSERSMVDGALAAYDRCFRGGGIGQIIWTRDLFIVASDPGRNPIDVVDVSQVSGTDRFLIYGPYIQLPPGAWTARVVIGLSQETAGHTFLVDAFAGKPLACTSFQATGSGVYAPEITFSLDEPASQGLEMRILVGSSNAQGLLALGPVVLSPLAIRSLDTVIGSLGDFRAVLDL